MNARAQREIDDIVDDVAGFVEEVRLEYGDAEAVAFVERMASRIGEMKEAAEQ